MYSTFVYLFTEGYYCLVDPRKDTNIGILWCLLTVFFSMYPSSAVCPGGPPHPSKGGETFSSVLCRLMKDRKR